jgi:hypothetical protein
MPSNDIPPGSPQVVKDFVIKFLDDHFPDGWAHNEDWVIEGFAQMVIEYHDLKKGE